MPAIAIVYVLLGLLLVGLSVPLMRGKVKPNPWYGFRIHLTLDNPDLWYPANAWAGRRLLAVGVGMTVGACLSFLIPDVWLPTYFLVIAGLLVAGLILITALGVRYVGSLDER